ncbi:unnamed protein product [Merluccius merluccius]
MGDNSTSSSSSSITSSNHTGSNGSFTGGLGQFGNNNGAWSFWLQMFSMLSMEIITDCFAVSENMVWVAIKTCFLVTGLLANAGLMWVLLSSKKPLSPSEVLALNLSILDLLSCFCLPLELYTSLNPISKQLLSMTNALTMPKIIGCPLLLTFMCFERYLAVARPLAYIKLGKWEYRAALCACAWIITLVVALLVYFLGYSMILYLAIAISVLFLLMLFCLVGIARVLCRSGPGEGSANNAPLKRRALKNILAVMVPAVVAYASQVVLVPFIVVVKSQCGVNVTPVQCQILQVLMVSPNFGIYIGPIFYLSRVRQLLCWKRNDKGREQTRASFKTQAE